MKKSKKILLSIMLLIFIGGNLNSIIIKDWKAFLQRVTIWSQKLQKWEEFLELFRLQHRKFQLLKLWTTYSLTGFSTSDLRIFSQADIVEHIAEMLNSTFFRDIGLKDEWNFIFNKLKKITEMFEHITDFLFMKDNFFYDHGNKDYKEYIEKLIDYKYKKIEQLQTLVDKLNKIRQFEEKLISKFEIYEKKLTKYSVGEKGISNKTKLMILTNEMELEMVLILDFLLILERISMEDQVKEYLYDSDIINTIQRILQKYRSK
jgi:hypothetical protein